MEEKLNQLDALLLQEVALHESLCAELEKEAAGDGQLDGAALLRLQRNKNQTVREIQELEAERLVLVEAIAAAWSEDAAELTLRRIVPRAPVTIGENLSRRHGRLMELVTQIRELAALTGGNAQARLKAIEATLAIINEAVKMHPT